MIYSPFQVPFSVYYFICWQFYSGHIHPSVLSPPSPTLPTHTSSLSHFSGFLGLLCDPLGWSRATHVGLDVNLPTGRWVTLQWLCHRRIVCPQQPPAAVGFLGGAGTTELFTLCECMSLVSYHVRATGLPVPTHSVFYFLLSFQVYFLTSFPTLALFWWNCVSH